MNKGRTGKGKKSLKQPLSDRGPASATPDRVHHFVWLDLRDRADTDLRPFVEAALHHRLDGIVVADRDSLADLPPTVTRVWYPEAGADEPTPSAATDLVVRAPGATVKADVDVVVDVVDVVDAASLRTACEYAAVKPWTILTFSDPTKIPLEIVIAAADNASGHTVTIVHTLDEAAVVFGCLERGSDGILMRPTSIEDISALAELRDGQVGNVELTELTVTGTEHVGMGDRACLDTCSILGTDEGLLIGSFAGGLVLTCSETHPLPYMPTRPFRINAGAVHSYALSSPTRTNYLSELAAGHELIAVRTDGSARRVTLGRVKIERRPLLSISANGPGGKQVNIIVQDDWHVRLLGPGGHVHNVTELEAGDVLLGYLPNDSRHVGYPINEFCIER